MTDLTHEDYHEALLSFMEPFAYAVTKEALEIVIPIPLEPGLLAISLHTYYLSNAK